MAQAVDVQIIVRSWNLHFLEEYIRHVLVEMLTGMYNALGNSCFGQGAGDRGCLYKLWPRAKDGNNFHIKMSVLSLKP